MNDNDIINELEIRLKEICEFCACVDEDEPTICGGCTFHGVKIALSVINRQKAEIEMLQRAQDRFADIGKMYSEIRAEAIKEFAWMLKAGIHEDIQSGCDCADYLTDDLPDIIDSLVKEMTEE